MRGSLALTVAVAVLGLGCQEPTLPPPPIAASGGQGNPPIGGQASGSNGDASGTLDSGTGTGDASGSTTSGTVPLLSGQLLDGSAELVPVACYVRVHLLDSFDPGSGLPIQSVYEERVMLRALPQAYAIASVPSGLVGPGDSVYVTTVCDVEGDGIADNVGGYYPGIPVEPVLLPAVEIDLTLDVLF